MKRLQLQKPHVLIVVGLPGAGKTFFASQFSDMFHAPYLDYGRYRQVIGEPQTANELASDAYSQLLRTRQTLLIEGIGDKKLERREIVKNAHTHGYGVLFVWVQTDPQTSEHRSVYSKTATISAHEFAARATQFELIGSPETYVVISGKHTFATQAKVVLKKLVAAKTDEKQSHTPGNDTNRQASARGRISIG